MECTAVDKLKTNNADHTGCIENKALQSDSIVEEMFSTGGAFYISFGISALFAFLCGFMQYKREMAPENTVGMIRRWQVLLKSIPQGFSFSSEMILIAAMLHKAPGIAAAMILFRCMHPLTVMCYIHDYVWKRKVD